MKDLERMQELSGVGQLNEIAKMPRKIEIRFRIKELKKEIIEREIELAKLRIERAKSIIADLDPEEESYKTNLSAFSGQVHDNSVEIKEKEKELEEIDEY